MILKLGLLVLHLQQILTTPATHATSSLIVQVPLVDLDQLLHLQSISAGAHTTYASFQVLMLILPLLIDWVVDSKVSSHMEGFKDKFDPICFSGKFPTVPYSLYCWWFFTRGWYGMVQTTTSLILKDISFVPKFPINLLSISRITIAIVL